MPGIFGQIGCEESVERRLRSAAEAVWGDIEWVKLPRGLVGGHAHRGQALWEPCPSTRVAVDGDAALYQSMPVETSPRCAGNILRANLTTGELSVASDASGSFPLFYAKVGDGLAFSSLQRVLADALDSASADLTGCIEAMRFGATLVGRSCLQGIARLLPGQTLRFGPVAKVGVSETSTLWSERMDLPVGKATHDAWDALCEAASATIPSTGEVALMMSAGWDSRTLLAVLQHTGLGDRLRCYTHGDLGSREIRIAKAISHRRGLKHDTEPIDDAIFDYRLVQQSFARTECLIFPHWHRAGALLRGMGVAVGTSGVFGGVIGGHYGPPSVMSARGKVRAVLGHFLTDHYSALKDRRDVERLLQVHDTRVPWYLNSDLMSPEEYCLRINTDIVESLDRLEARGVRHPEQMLEAFLVESRGAQYMNAQDLSIRAFIDVANLFSGEEALRLASSLNMHTRIHNRLNRAMLLRHAPDLTDFPMAATLVAARRPLLIQEASRLVRRTWGAIRQRAGRSFGGGVRPRLGWVNFDFMKRSDAVRQIYSTMVADIWDHAALRSRVQGLRAMPESSNVHPAFDQLGKLLTVDRLLVSRRTNS